jgi:DNA-binding transcriptional LysR family regulator
MDVNTRNFRIFLEVLKSKSFSEAARILKITQPTVSQQIAKLESDIGKKLFERHGHELIPTEIANKLSIYAEEIIDQVSKFSDDVSEFTNKPKGLVRYAMPESCQWTPHFSKIMREMSTYPDLQFEVEIVPPNATAEGILTGRFDFGFITGDKLTPELRFDKFSDEVYSCFASEKDLFNPLKSREVSQLRFISFPGWELFFSTWMKKNNFLKLFKTSGLKPTLHIGTLAGAIHAVKTGVGIAILPRHCVFEEIANEKLLELDLKNEQASCPIYLCQKVGRKQTRRAELVIELLRKAKLEIK